MHSLRYVVLKNVRLKSANKEKKGNQLGVWYIQPDDHDGIQKVYEPLRVYYLSFCTPYDSDPAVRQIPDGNCFVTLCNMRSDDDSDHSSLMYPTSSR